ncbi:acetyl-CoA hydrolase/transferase C-terminal domain-containing protein, partial [Pseudofrankia sp. BMG5.37]|uniref:acetyl-CoA hydrolase/transferase C-terminal domain-containing protein n=1 Tax=Pseudofrankia sp. BMG5.37 TaxID=3050035 RepID=UPI00289478EE
RCGGVGFPPPYRCWGGPTPLMPYTFGDSVIPASALDVIVHDEAELPVLTNRPAGPRDRALAMSVAETIPDGALLQVGVGVLPDAVIAGLVDLGRRNLRQFSMLTDSFLELVKHRALTDEGPQAIVGEIVGSSALYDYVRENRRVTMADGRRTHAMKGLLERKGLVVLGSALEVDLLGQANLEVRGGAQFSGVGGAMDFGVAAATSQATADSVIMLHSATADGTSRIVPRLSGGMVSLPRTLVRRVVTEHGAAVLDSASARERAERLVAVADPAHRDELARHLRANPALFGA